VRAQVALQELSERHPSVMGFMDEGVMNRLYGMPLQQVRQRLRVRVRCVVCAVCMVRA
jgi:hypothetical protein